MKRRAADSDNQIRSMLESRTFGSSAADLLDEVGRRCAQLPRVRPREFSSTRHLRAVALVGAAVIAIGFVASSQLWPAVGALATVRPNASPGAPPMAAGRWVTSTFQPAIAFTVPDRLWVATAETPQRLSLKAFLARPGTAGDLSISWLTGTYAEPCTTGAAGPTTAWQGSTAEDFMAWLRRVLPIEPGAAMPISVASDPGLQVEFTVPPGAESRCPAVALTHELALGPDGSTDGSIAVPLGTDRVRITAAVIDSRTLVVVTATSDPVHFAEVAVIADPLVRSLEVR